MRDLLLEVLFPPVSLTRTPGTWLTADERAALRAYPHMFEGAALVRRGMPSVDRLLSAASYGASPLLREAVRRFKYRRASVYGGVLADMIAEASRYLPAWPPPVVCPVPLHWTRRFVRGFNQADILAHAVAAPRGWPMRPLLVRVRATGSQARRTHEERRRAVVGAFACAADGNVPERVVLVDDVVTSGATLEACAVALREAGVRRIDAVTIAVAFT